MSKGANVACFCHHLPLNTHVVHRSERFNGSSRILYGRVFHRHECEYSATFKLLRHCNGRRILRTLLDEHFECY